VNKIINSGKKPAKKGITQGFKSQKYQNNNKEITPNKDGINWAAIAQKLPMDKTSDQVKKRASMFRQIDMNGNGYVSLAEMDKAVLAVLQCEEIFKAKPVIVRAFNAAKNAVKSKGKSKVGDD